MNYTEALEYIHSISWTFCKPGLDRIKELCEKFGTKVKIKNNKIEINFVNGSDLNRILEVMGIIPRG